MKRFTLNLVFSALLIVLISNVYAAEKAYHIGPGDIIEISVWKDPDLSRTLVVPPDGVIAFPLISAIDVTNLTVAELKNIVTKKEFINKYKFSPTSLKQSLEVLLDKQFIHEKLEDGESTYSVYDVFLSRWLENKS